MSGPVGPRTLQAPRYRKLAEAASAAAIAILFTLSAGVTRSPVAFQGPSQLQLSESTTVSENNSTSGAVNPNPDPSGVSASSIRTNSSELNETGAICQLDCGSPLDLPADSTRVTAPYAKTSAAPDAILGYDYAFYANLTISYEASSIWTSIGIPSSGPVDGDEYAVLLDTLDSDGYLDQIGVSSDYGCGADNGCVDPYDTWTIAWEKGTYGSSGGGSNCGSGPGTVYSRSAYEQPGLTPETWYTFFMNLAGGHLNFFVYEGQDSFNNEVWNYSVVDPATYFQIVPEASNCYGAPEGDGYFYGMTLQEENDIIDSSIQDFPRWDFSYLDTTIYTPAGEDTLIIPDSEFDTSGPTPASGYLWDFSLGPDTIRAANEAFGISFPKDAYTITAGGAGFSTSGQLFPVGAQSYKGTDDYCVVNSCQVTYTGTCESGWSCTFSSYDAVPTSYQPGSWIFSASAPGSAAPGLYYLGVSDTMTSTSPEQYTSFIFYVMVSPS